MHRAKIVAEIGCNHMGNFATAKKMIEAAASCGAQYAKFQKRCPRELLSEEEYNAPHPSPRNSYGATYGEHREFLEFDIDQHIELKKICAKNDIGYACSVWDITSCLEIMSISPDYLKIPSAMNLCRPIFDTIRNVGYQGEVHVSLGMTTRDEEHDIVSMFASCGWYENLVLYHCTSGYPVPFEDLCLLEIKRLREDYPSVPIGYSGHNTGIAVDVAAYAMGVTWIERHFTLDRCAKGTDHSASLEPSMLRQLVQDIESTRIALSYKPTRTMLEIEMESRKKLKKTRLSEIMVEEE